jgi:hypothetical protein
MYFLHPLSVLNEHQHVAAYLESISENFLRLIVRRAAILPSTLPSLMPL